MRRAFALLFALLGPAAPEGDAARGRLLYEHGVDALGRPAARLELGAGGQTASADRFPCAACHGPTGRGGQEAGQALPPVRWAALATPGSRGRRAGYTPATLLRAVRTGLDADGEPLSPVMPRYHLTDAQAADLVAWLQGMDDVLAPGVTDDTVAVGTILPLSGPRGEAGRAAAALLQAVVEGWNGAGGLYGRDVRLLVRDAPDVAAAHAALADLADDVLCLVGPAGPGADPAVLAAAVELGVPVLGPAAPAPATSVPEPVFYFLPPLGEGAHVLADHAVRRVDGACRLSAPAPGDPWIDAFTTRATERGCALVGAGATGARLPDDSAAPATRADSAAPATLADEAAPATRADEAAPATRADEAAPATLADEAAPATLALLPGEGATDAITRREAAGEHPVWVVAPSGPAGLAALDTLPADVAARVVPALALGLPDPESPEVRALVARAARLGSSPAARSAEARAWVAARLLEEALLRSGHELDRPALVRALEAVRALPTGVTPPLSFDRGQHLGAHAAPPTSLAEARAGR